MKKTKFTTNNFSAVGYQIGDDEKNPAIVTFETRHNVGHAFIEALSEEGIDVNKLVNRKGKPTEKFEFVISGMVNTHKQLLVEKKVLDPMTAFRNPVAMHTKVSQHTATVETVGKKRNKKKKFTGPLGFITPPVGDLNI